jgi:selenocysteine-specific elongation factor
VGVAPAEVTAVIATSEGIVRAGDRLIPQTSAESAKQRALDQLASHHQAQPLLPGMPLEAFRQLVGAPDVAAQLLEGLGAEGLVVQDGGWVRLAAHQPRIPPELAGPADAVRRSLEAAGFEGVTPGAMGLSRPGVEPTELAEFFVREGTAIRVGNDRYYDRAKLTSAAGVIIDLIRERGQASPAEVRDKLGLTRKYLIPLLEWMDAQGLTMRVGDVRRLGPAANQLHQGALDGFRSQS